MNIKSLDLDHPARQIRLTGEESLMLPNLARGRFLSRDILLDSIESTPWSSDVTRRVALLIIGEPVSGYSEEEMHLAQRYLAWANAPKENF